jgi:hypothetical protein
LHGQQVVYVIDILFDATGWQVHQTALVPGINEMETAGLPSGIFFWRIESAGEVLQQGKSVKVW